MIYWSSKDVSLFVAQQVVADAIADAEENAIGATAVAAGATSKEKEGAEPREWVGSIGVAGSEGFKRDP